MDVTNKIAAIDIKRYSPKLYYQGGERLMLQNILLLLLNKEDKYMMALLWAQQIMLGKKIYAQVPRLLKEKVKEILIDSGMEELVID